MRAIAIIPARYDSTRFPGKLLVRLLTKPILQWVYENAEKTEIFDQVIIATPDQQIFDFALSIGAKVRKTHKDHKTGTDRCAEIAESFDANDLIINIQGDEPFISPKAVSRLVELMRKNLKGRITTLTTIFENDRQIIDPNTVKVVANKDGEALYFSRSVIPFAPIHSEFKIRDFKKHIGIYSYRNSTLQELAQLDQSKLELSEGLEQLRWIENGYRIDIIECHFNHLSINIPDDLLEAEKLIKRQISELRG